MNAAAAATARIVIADFTTNARFSTSVARPFPDPHWELFRGAARFAHRHRHPGRERRGCSCVGSQPSQKLHNRPPSPSRKPAEVPDAPSVLHGLDPSLRSFQVSLSRSQVWSNDRSQRRGEAPFAEAYGSASSITEYPLMTVPATATDKCNVCIVASQWPTTMRTRHSKSSPCIPLRQGETRGKGDETQHSKPACRLIRTKTTQNKKSHKRAEVNHEQSNL